MSRRSSGPAGGPAARIGDAALLALLLAVALWLRLPRLEETSLWWDELVEIAFAQPRQLGQVWWAVRAGVPAGLGNAGAAPLDYLLLWAWTHWVPAPAPEWLETYFRLPSCAASVATVGALFLAGRRFLGRGPAFVAAFVLALSVPHALYAAEARFYSLLGLVVVLNLAAFAAVLERPASARAWLVHLATGVLCFGTGIASLLLLAGQYPIAGAVAIGRLRGPARRRALAALVFSALALAGSVAAYWAHTDLGVRFGRPVAGLRLVSATREALAFFAFGAPLASFTFAASLPLVALASLRLGRPRAHVALHLVIAFAAIPALAAIARWKGYALHPRHSLLLLPYWAIAIAVGLTAALRLVDPFGRPWLGWRAPGPGARRALEAALACALVVASAAPPIALLLARPRASAALVKQTQDLAGLTATLRARVAALPPGSVYLLVAQRGRPGFLATPVLARYLRWYGIEDRVAVRTTPAIEDARRRLRAFCAERCIGRRVSAFEVALAASRSIEVGGGFRRLLRLPRVLGASASRVGGVGLLAYRVRELRRRGPGESVTRLPGLALIEPAP